MVLNCVEGGFSNAFQNLFVESLIQNIRSSKCNDDMHVRKSTYVLVGTVMVRPGLYPQNIEEETHGKQHN